MHAYGTPLLIDDAGKLRAMVAALVRRHEADRRPSWTIEQAGAMIETKLRGIVGIEIPIDRIEGRFKFDQNMSREDRVGVVSALASTSESGEREVAKLMESGRAAEATTAPGAARGADAPGEAAWASDWIGRWAKGW